jgi:predicted Zn-dependent peptidase
MRTARIASCLLAIAVAACKGPALMPAAAPKPSASSPTEQADNLERVRESPPASGPARDLAFPTIARAELPNGLRLAVVPARALPLVQIRVVVKAGTAADGDLTGLASLTAQTLKEGGAGRYSSRELLTRIETLGGNLGVEVGPDSTVVSLAVTRSHFDEALDLLGALMQSPKLDPVEFTKLKRRAVQRAADRAKSSGTWAATMLLWREIFRLPTGLHPYGAYEATAAEIQRIKVADCREFYRKAYSPKSTVIVVTGDSDLESTKRGVERALGSWKGPEPFEPAFAEATPPDHPRILLADRPKSTQSDVYVAVLGPERREDAWTDAKVANQVLGGGVSSRLFSDVREKKSLAYSTRSSLGELAKGPVPLAAYAGTQTAKTGLTLQALLDNMKRLASEPVGAEELDTARRYLADVFAVKMETVGSLADMVASLEVLGLPDDYYDTYRKAVSQVTPAAALAAAGEAIRDGHWVIAIAGDADKIGPALSRFGDVLVYNPEKEFEKLRTIPANPAAPLEVEGAPGK